MAGEARRPDRQAVGDETFGCGGLLLHARAVGFDTFVTCATRGEAGEDRDGRSGTELGKVRATELGRAAEALGVCSVGLLDFADSGMAGPAPDRSLVGTDLDEVVAAVAASMRRVRPDAVLTLDASDGHRDHERIREATLLAATEVGVATVHLSCLPASLMRQWWERMRAEQPDKGHVRDADEPVIFGTPDSEISTLIDVREYRERLASRWPSTPPRTRHTTASPRICATGSWTPPAPVGSPRPGTAPPSSTPSSRRRRR